MALFSGSFVRAGGYQGSFTVELPGPILRVSTFDNCFYSASIARYDLVIEIFYCSDHNYRLQLPCKHIRETLQHAILLQQPGF